MQRGRLLVLVGLFLFIIAGVVIVFILLRGQLTPQEPTPTPEGPVIAPVEMTEIVIAQRSLKRGEEIPQDAIAMAPWATRALPQTAITDPAQVVGKLARYDIEPSEPILTTLLADDPSELSATGSEAALKIPLGQVAVTLPMTRLSGVGYALSEGDHVNVLVSMLFVDVAETTQAVLPDKAKLVGASIDPTTGNVTIQLLDLGDRGEFLIDPAQSELPLYVQPSEAQRPRLVVQQIVQDAVVLKVGTFTETDVVFALPSPTPLPEGSPPPPPTPIPPPDIITLIVAPQDALVLNYFLYAQAKFTLALRAAADTSRVDTESVTLQYAIERFRISVPQPLNFALQPAVRELKPPTLPNEPAPVIVPLPDGTYLCAGGNCP